MPYESYDYESYDSCTLFWRVNRILTIVADGFTDALQEAREQEASDKADAAAAAIRAAGGAGTAVAAAAAVGDGDNNESDDEQMENKTESCCFGKGQCDNWLLLLFLLRRDGNCAATCEHHADVRSTT